MNLIIFFMVLNVLVIVALIVSRKCLFTYQDANDWLLVPVGCFVFLFIVHLTGVAGDLDTDQILSLYRFLFP